MANFFKTRIVVVKTEGNEESFEELKSKAKAFFEDDATEEATCVLSDEKNEVIEKALGVPIELDDRSSFRLDMERDTFVSDERVGFAFVSAYSAEAPLDFAEKLSEKFKSKVYVVWSDEDERFNEDDEDFRDEESSGRGILENGNFRYELPHNKMQAHIFFNMAWNGYIVPGQEAEYNGGCYAFASNKQGWGYVPFHKDFFNKNHLSDSCLKDSDGNFDYPDVIDWIDARDKESAWVKGEDVESVESAADENNFDNFQFLTVEDGVLTDISQYAQSIKIPADVKKIDNWAFMRCQLRSIEFGGTVAQWEAIEEKGGLERLESIKCSDGTWQSPELEIKNGVLLHFNRRSAESAEIPDGVTEIGESAFAGCESLSSVVIPEGVTEIGESAFDGCKSLSSVVIPEGVTKIGMWAFSGCSSLSSVEFGGTMAQWKAIERCIFWNEYVPAKTVKCTDGEAELE